MISTSATALWSTTTVRWRLLVKTYFTETAILICKEWIILEISAKKLTCIYAKKVHKTWKELINKKISPINNVDRRSPQAKASSWMKCALAMPLEFLMRTFHWRIPIRNTDGSQNNWSLTQTFFLKLSILTGNIFKRLKILKAEATCIPFNMVKYSDFLTLKSL